ncbi:polysaccharide deacetylase family protein [Winogradskyella bathintestinalis]|uniref:Polysaccharide deacetylase family protein n=1 Tax=Winogradskyella bathintestinalis TaxID=3035208 RepID=A0ABT7ZQK6_9FLAO|nr:polysaccharide deacetylase family protein [Winogradskyella bathintestinalis]MDN3491109.1 polysaccharide deacetylase family protein [Winogradskyella bathintestinalis]
MTIIPAKTPDFVKTLFPNFIWNIDTIEKELYLTFDDGPTPEITDWVLQTLKDYNAKATFFCIGNNIEKHPGIFQNIINDGHAIGNHTYHHLKGWKHKTKAYLTDVIQTENIIKSKLQLQDVEVNIVNLFRPPYGKLKSKQSQQIQDLSYKIVMWDVLSFDWDISVSEDTCLKNVTSSGKKGSIIVFHDSVKASRNLQYVLPKVLDYYTNTGFQFKSLKF